MAQPRTDLRYDEDKSLSATAMSALYPWGPGIM